MNLEDIKLESFSLNRAPELFQLVDDNRDYLGAQLPWVSGNTKIEDSKKFIQNTLDSLEKKEAVVAYNIIFENKIIGLIDVYNVNIETKLFEIGYWLDQSMQGRGIITYVCEKIMNQMFDLGYQTAQIRCASKNPKSCAIPERLGFTRKEILEKAEPLNGELRDMEVWIKQNPHS